MNETQNFQTSRVTAKELLAELKPLIAEFFLGTVEERGSALRLTLVNG